MSMARESADASLVDVTACGREQRSERGRERRRDGVDSVPLGGRYQDSYREPAAAGVRF